LLIYWIILIYTNTFLSLKQTRIKNVSMFN
jgi:hypothetical protein